MRRSSLVLALLLPASALAQGKPVKRPPQTFTLTKETHTAAEDVARARFAAGDCKGALDAFDVAIEHSIDPTLYRDRGICHEKLDHVFPAIDDYRVYVSARPTAPDTEKIRERLARLEGHELPKDGGDPTLERPTSTRTITEIERDRDLKDEAEGSSLRLGKGWVLGAFIGLRAFSFRLLNRDVIAFGQRAGATLRASVDAHNTFMLDLGWAWNDADRPSGSSGPSLYGGWEYRLQLDRYGAHALLFGLLLGYERTVGNGQPLALNGIAGRGRFGYRVTFGPSFALEGTADGGPISMWAEIGGGAISTFAIGGHFSIVVGF